MLGSAGLIEMKKLTLNTEDVIDAADTYAEENPLGRSEDYLISKDPNELYVQALIGEYLATYGNQLK